ncbi:MAG: glycine--tRNA ligase subunit beta [Collinsella sp.]
MGGLRHRDGENEEVARYSRSLSPRFAGDELPEGTAGCIVACADKLDTIAGIFAIGEPPTGSSTRTRCVVPPSASSTSCATVCRSTPRRSSTCARAL